jgi:hypothetical protein
MLPMRRRHQRLTCDFIARLDFRQKRGKALCAVTSKSGRGRYPQGGHQPPLCVAKSASAPKIRDFRVDAALCQGDVIPTFRD